MAGEDSQGGLPIPTEPNQPPSVEHPDAVPIGQSEVRSIPVHEGIGELGVASAGAGNTAFTEVDSGIRQDEPKARVEDPDAAREMAEAQSPVQVMISNVNHSDLPEDTKTTLKEKLEKEADELGDQAKAKYEANQEAYKYVEDHLIGTVAALSRGDIKSEVHILLANNGLGVPQNGNIMPEGFDSLTDEQFEDLRQKLYALSGVKAPKFSETLEGCEVISKDTYGRAKTVQVSIPTGLGFTLTEKLAVQSDSPITQPAVYRAGRFSIGAKPQE